MGLDNYICVKIKLNDEHTYVRIPTFFSHNCEDNWLELDDTDSAFPCIHFELVYWRKWWGPRNEVVYNLQAKYGFEEVYHYNLDSEDIEMIIDVLEYYKNKDIWEENSDSIWSYEEDNIEDQIDIDIDVLKRLVKFMRDASYRKMLKDKTIEVYFIDSY